MIISNVYEVFLHKIQSWYIILNHFNLSLIRVMELCNRPCLHPRPLAHARDLALYDKLMIYARGGALPLIFCIHVHSGPIYWGAIYLAKKIIRYGIFQNKGKCLHFNTPISNYNFMGESLKTTLIYLYYIFFLILQVYAKLSIQVVPTKNYLFSSTSTNPIPNPLPLIIVFMLFYMYRLDKRCHYM
jgi:hypothetical protein